MLQILTLIATICTEIYGIFFIKKTKVTPKKTQVFQLEKKPTKSLLKSSKKATFAVKSTNLLEKSTKIDDQTNFDKGIQKVEGKSIRQMTLRKRVKVEQIAPGNEMYDQIEVHDRSNHRQVSFKPKIMKKTDSKQFNSQKIAEQIEFVREGLVKKSTYKSKLRLKTKTNRTINELSLNVKHG